MVATVRYLKERAALPVRSSLAILKLPRATYFRWAAQDGKAPRPEVVVP